MRRAVLALLLFLILAPAAFAERRVALVIGNQAYASLSILANPALDAGRMAAILGDNGFDVMSCDGTRPGCFDLDRNGMVVALAEFADMTAGADLAFVFYAGHGMQTAAGNVLAPVDMTLDCDTLDPARATMLDNVMEALSGAREKIVILDACRNDPLASQQCAQRGARPLSFGSLVLPKSDNRFLIVTSTKPGDVARDGLPGAHSPFAESLFQAMEVAPGARFDQLFDRVTRQVVKKTAAANFTQVPEVFIRGGAPDACLAGDSCAEDPEAASLKAEVERLRNEHRRAQEYEAIALIVLRDAGYESLDAVPADRRDSFLNGLVGVGKSLGKRGDAAAERALAALKTGDETAATRLFEEDIAANLADADQARRTAASSYRHLAALAWPSDVAKAALHFASAVELDPTDIQAWVDYGETLLTIGKSPEANDAFVHAAELAGHAGPSVPAVKAAYLQGDVAFAQGRFGDAIGFYESAKTLAEKLAPRGEAGRSRLLAAIHTKIGDFLGSRDDFDGALAAFKMANDITVQLVADAPGDAQSQRDLATAHENLGAVYGAMRRTELARSWHVAALDIRRKLWQAERENYARSRDMARSYGYIGDSDWNQFRHESALDSYDAALSIMKTVTSADPRNGEWQRGLWLAYGNVGMVHRARGDTASAREALENGFKVMQRLANSHPNNAEWQYDLYLSHLDMALYEEDKIEHLQAALDIVQRLEAEGRLAPSRAAAVDYARARLNQALVEPRN